MSTLFLTVLSVAAAGAVAVLCYVFLYRESVLVIQRPFFFRVGAGALLGTIVGASTLLFDVVPIHLVHAVFAVSVAAAVHAVESGLHPNTEAWFYSLFES
ncbi:hypothetical protein [Halolamina sp. C58]|uniref:hypothetical protein n=1 Tax=Halolamina sp. C58 TaxID=3421640 RepID=UPI003EB94406